MNTNYNKIIRMSARASCGNNYSHIWWFNFSKYDVLQFEKGFCVVYILKKYLLNNVKTEVHTLQLLETSTKSVYDVGTRKNSFFWCFEKYISNRSKHYFLIKGELEMKFPSLQLNMFSTPLCLNSVKLSRYASIQLNSKDLNKSW